MTYEESGQLTSDPAFRARVKVACLKLSSSIFAEVQTAPAHNVRVRWATTCCQQPDTVSMQVQPLTVMDPAVQEAGADITDAALQAAVEGVINNIL